jgi:hypothetical protein
MLWFYARSEQSLTVETRFDNDTHEYVAIVTGALPYPETKRFPTSEAFRAWLQLLEGRLAAERWKADGAPHVLPDGWPDKRPLA